MPDHQSVPRTDAVLRVVKGSPSPEELAAVTALLMARLAAPGDDTDTGTGTAGTGPAVAGWRRPERRPPFVGPRTWRRP
ncbi:acyl-CoA carboxylase subunit epsilon [Streptomyces brasiliscabiei]|uniref:Acyl-CoA carboxylase subunit epsilon n=1 Tax=Streptomyces brasiliscabiei TaxID=2736302 RepID=A0ABU8GPK9_9ACTN